MRHHHSRWCYAGGTFAGILLMLFLIAVFDRRGPITVTESHFLLQSVRAGMPVTVEWTTKEHRPRCDGVVWRVWIDSQGTRFDTQRELVVWHEPRESPQTFHRTLLVPSGMTPGPATYTSFAERWCNSLQHAIWPMTFKLPEIKFEVVP